MEDKQLFCCSICSKSYGQWSSLSKHIKNHLQNKTLNVQCEKISMDSLRCPRCKIFYCTEGELQTHVLNMHPEAKQNSFTNYPSKAKIGKQLQKNGKKDIECTICAKIYKSKAHLRKHTKKVHTNSQDVNEAIVCNVCDNQFNNKKSFNEHHKKFHSGAKERLNCYICGKVMQKHSLKNHIELVHSDKSEQVNV